MRHTGLVHTEQWRGRTLETDRFGVHETGCPYVGCTKVLRDEEDVIRGLKRYKLFRRGWRNIYNLKH